METTSVEFSTEPELDLKTLKEIASKVRDIQRKHNEQMIAEFKEMSKLYACPPGQTPDIIIVTYGDIQNQCFMVSRKIYDSLLDLARIEKPRPDFPTKLFGFNVMLNPSERFNPNERS